MRHLHGIVSDRVRVLLADPFPINEINATEPAPQAIYRYAPGESIGQPTYSVHKRQQG